MQNKEEFFQSFKESLKKEFFLLRKTEALSAFIGGLFILITSLGITYNEIRKQVAESTVKQKIEEIILMHEKAFKLVGSVDSLRYQSLRMSFLPKGTILAWYGDTIPSGWILCDGNNGSPNLLGKFLRGASSIGGSGGSEVHSHVTDHVNGKGTADGYRVSGDRGAPQASGLNHVHPIYEASNIPPYVEVVFIFKTK